MKRFFYTNKAAMLFTANTLAGIIDATTKQVDDGKTPICKWEHGIESSEVPAFKEYAASKKPAICTTYEPAIQYILRGGNPTAVGYWQQLYRSVGQERGFIKSDTVELDIENATLEDAVKWYKEFMGKNLYGSDTAWLGYACFNKILYKAGIGLCCTNNEATAKEIGLMAYAGDLGFVDKLAENLVRIPAKYTSSANKEG